ncbi:zinc finger protein 90-like [Zophobas morio]|uniref:zinc finger protein 90-like n=1 Tax=Zophobas morio TaxID=2755281 RepID=UPI003083A335
MSIKVISQNQRGLLSPTRFFDRFNRWRHAGLREKYPLFIESDPNTMKRVRCTICRHQLPNLKTLKSHYVTRHSKIQIIKELFKSSILSATPALLAKSIRRKIQQKYKTVYLHDKVQITYSNDTIIIEDGSSDDNLIELTFDDNQNLTIPVLEQGSAKDKAGQSRRKSRKNKKSKKLFRIGIKKVTEVPKSLHEQTGEFYECHCMEKGSQKTSSDTESGSDSGRIFYCNFCGNGYQTVAELTQHENMHQYYCKLCNLIFNIPNHREHMDQHIVRIYVCHLCGFEFICKDMLIGHLGYHFEQQTFEHILNMEQDYNMYGFCNTNFASGDYYSNITNILFFLTYPYDHYYSRNMFMKVVCDICYQEFYIYDYERHMKIAHFVR